jgi:hypothetical protein
LSAAISFLGGVFLPENPGLDKQHPRDANQTHQDEDVFNELVRR